MAVCTIQLKANFEVETMSLTTFQETTTQWY